MVKFRFIEGVFRDSCLKWGYEEVRTPTLEYLHLFTSAGTLTPSLLGRVYSFLDWDGWSGERVVLRPDGTIPVARLYTESMEDRELAKLFYVTNIFVFEPTGKETREKWQCGAELIGGRTPVADVELIMLALETLQGLGLKDIEIRLSHAGLIRGVLGKLGLSVEERTEIFDKILDGDISALTRMEAEKPELGGILPLLFGLQGKSLGFLKNLQAVVARNLSELESPLTDFIGVVDLLEALGCQYKLDLASGRSFEYYTGVIFQLFWCDEMVGGGGRYDALIPLIGGRDAPASGFALYLDRLMRLVEVGTPGTRPAKVLVRAETGERESMKTSFSIARQLRDAGCVVEFNLGHERPDLRWVLDTRNQAPGFILTDRVKRRKYEAKTVDEVLSLLRR